MGVSTSVALFPLCGPFHTRWPRYSAVHLRECVRAFSPDVVALEPLPPGATSDPAWQDTDEVALPLAVVPWARRAGVRVVEVGLAEGDPDAPGEPGAVEALRRYLEMYDEGRTRLRRAEEAWAPVRALLTRPLDLGRVLQELLPAIEEQQRVEREALGAGPGDRWRDAHADVVVARLLSAVGEPGQATPGRVSLKVALMAGVESVPALRRALHRVSVGSSGVDVRVVEPVEVEAGDEGRQRALPDAAMSGAGEPEALLRALRDLPAPEARYHEANLLFELGRLDEAVAVLSDLVAGDFHEPYYLPGFALARLGQLLDLVPRREEAVRRYRGVMALTFAPAAARAAAAAGLAAPFTLASPGGTGA